MAKPKERSVTLRVVFTMKRQGEEKGEAAFPLILKRVQTVLGEKYNVLRLEVLHGDVKDILDDSDMIYEAGQRWGEARVNLYGPLIPEEMAEDRERLEEALGHIPEHVPSDEEQDAEILRLRAEEEDNPAVIQEEEDAEGIVPEPDDSSDRLPEQ
jgi:hypothetical protein